MRVLFQCFHRLLNIADIPELDLAVVSAARQVVLTVWIKVQVTHQLAMSIFYTVDLTEKKEDKQGDKKRRKINIC